MKNIKFNESFFIIFSALASLILFLPIFLQDIVYLDRIFLPDDTYYTLTIARNIANGCGASIDCINKTSGFQPLITLFSIPAFLLTDNLYTPIKVAIGFSAIFGILTNVVMTLVYYKHTKNTVLSIIFGVFLIAFHNNILNYFNGLETSLAMFMGSLLIFMLQKYYGRSLSRVHILALGGLIAFAMLARIDMSIMVFFIGLYLLVNHGLRSTFFIAVTALIIISPMWGYNLIYTGSILPESGQAVKNIVAFHQTVHLTPLKSMQMAWKTLDVFSLHYATSSFISLAILFLSCCHGVYAAIKNKNFTLELVLIVTMISMIGFYVFYLPAFWFFDRYLAFSLLLGVFLVFCLFEKIMVANRKMPTIKPFLFFMVSLFVFSNAIKMPLFFSKPETTLYYGEKGARGYMEIADFIVDNISENSTIASMQSGALGYFAAKHNHRVHNLDGVVNNAVLPLILNKEVNVYLKENQVAYFADWSFNTFWLSNIVEDNSVQLEPLFSTKMQGDNDGYVVYKVLLRE